MEVKVKHSPINTENTLHIVRRIPRRIENYDTIRCNQIDSQATSFSRNKKQSRTKIGGIVERIARVFTQLR